MRIVITVPYLIVRIDSLLSVIIKHIPVRVPTDVHKLGMSIWIGIPVFLWTMGKYYRIFGRFVVLLRKTGEKNEKVV